MPKLKPETLAARRMAILDAAEISFAQTGFHGTSMQDICRAAGVSAGALYGYFDSKEALISGICERDRSEFAEQFSKVAEAADFLDAMHTLADYYLVERPVHKRLLMLEIGAEATRNPAIGEMCAQIDALVVDSFAALFERLRAEARIEPDLDSVTLAKFMVTLGDGLLWRSAIDPQFRSQDLLPTVLATIAMLVKPCEAMPDTPEQAVSFAMRQASTVTEPTS